MLKNYVKSALRNLRRHFGYSLLNLTGLALGIAAAFVILLYVWQELTYDRHFEDHDRIYRVATDFFDMGGFAKSQEKLLDHLPEAAPAVMAATRFDKGFQATAVRIGNRMYDEPDYLLVDSLFFQVFPHQFIMGDPTTVMQAPDEIVLSEKLAQKYFGTTAILGETLQIGRNKETYRVTGVVADSPNKTHMRANFWIPVKRQTADGWTNIYYYNYVKLHPGNTAADLEQGLDNLLRHVIYPASGSEEAFEAWLTRPQAPNFWVQPLTDIHLHSNYQFEIRAGGNPTQVYILGLIGLFILFIAGSNYVNLTTARSTVRAKEVAMRKTLGARRLMLVQQFLTETVIFSILAFGIAIGLAEVLLLIFEQITGSVLVESLFVQPQYLLVFLGLAVLVGLVAGIYPAFYLAGFQPIRLLRGKQRGTGNRLVQRGLVTVQFTVATALIIASVVVYQQLTFMQNVDKGFEKEGVLVVKSISRLGDQAETFRQQVTQLPQVRQTSFSRRTPAGTGIWMYTYETPEMAEAQTLQTFPVDDAFLETMGMRLIAGRNFSKDLASDSSALIVNESAVRALGLGDDPIGQVVNNNQTVIGVINNFNFQSLREQIAPVVLTYTDTYSQLAVKLTGHDIGDAIAQLSAIWGQFQPDDPIQYTFLDDNFVRLAAQDTMLGKAVSFFTILALIIAVLGLFALAAFAAERRTKEIGIRKVLGASMAGIVALLSKDFLRLVGIAFVIAAPLAYLVMSRWLEGFAFRMDLSWVVFAGAGLAAVLIAFLTVSWQALKAARANPVEALRYE